MKLHRYTTAELLAELQRREQESKPLPPGWYAAMMIESSLNEAGNLVCTFVFMEHKKTFTDEVRIRNDAPARMDQGYRHLAAIALSTVGGRIVRKSEELHNLPLKVKWDGMRARAYAALSPLLQEIYTW